MSLFEPEPGPDLADYDWIVVNSSGGKDSMAMLAVVYGMAEEAGVLDRVIVVHADLGTMEWEGAKELAQAQAEAYGLAFHVVKRAGGDLLDAVEKRGMWPSSQARYCTSDFKRTPVDGLLSRLAKASRNMGCSRPRTLNCMGFRKQESPARAKRLAFDPGDRLRPNKKGVMVLGRGTSSVRVTDQWLPIHDYSENDVWRTIGESRIKDLVHPAYGLGMGRLSCAFCIFCPKAGLVISGRHNTKLLDRYVEVQRKIGHKFRVDLDLEDVKRSVEAGEAVGAVSGWTM